MIVFVAFFSKGPETTQTKRNRAAVSSSKNVFRIQTIRNNFFLFVRNTCLIRFRRLKNSLIAWNRAASICRPALALDFGIARKLRTKSTASDRSEDELTTILRRRERFQINMLSGRSWLSFEERFCCRKGLLLSGRGVASSPFGPDPLDMIAPSDLSEVELVITMISPRNLFLSSKTSWSRFSMETGFCVAACC